METKVCCKCQKEKLSNDFSWKNQKINKRHSRCKDCVNQENQDRYILNINRKEQIRKTANTRNKFNREYIKRVKQLSNGCPCGEKRWYVLDFHHRFDKKYDISKLVRSGCSIKRIKNELRKCVLLCANCHRSIHFLESTECEPIC